MTDIDPGALLASADQRQIAGDLPGAIALYDALLDRAPGFWPAHANRGLALAVAGDVAAARTGFRRALTIEPSAIPALRNLADSLQTDQPEAGRPAARAFVAAAPHAFEAWLCLGCIELALSQSGLARRDLQRALVLNPACTDAAIAYTSAAPQAKTSWLQRAVAAEATPLTLVALARHQMTRDRDVARRLLRRALALAPAAPEPLSEITVAIDSFADSEELVAWSRRALLLQPDSAAVLNNIGAAQISLGELEDAVASFTKAIALRDDFAEAHFNRATPLFLLGRIDEARNDYQWRWRIDRFERAPSAAPQWTGDPLGDRRLLIHDEQGLGDTLQFVRYLPALARRGRIAFACNPRLVRLLRLAFPDIEIAARPTLPEHDLTLPLLDAPRFVGEVPATPYLKSPAVRSIDAGGRLRVGLVWAGNREHPRDRDRSMPLALLRPLLHQPGIAWFSMQVGPPRTDIPRLGLESVLPDVAIADFLATTATLAGLDLLVSVDTAPAHLAGALGMPVWTLMSWIPDWRWSLSGTTTPWYPSMRLFRQPRRRDWPSVVEQVSQALNGLRPAG